MHQKKSNMFFFFNRIKAEPINLNMILILYEFADNMVHVVYEKT